MTLPRTNVYIDGFNFYYGCFKNRRHPGDRSFKWLDIAAFCQAALPNHDIHRIKYFTAKVAGTSRNPQQHARQELYLRALSTCRNPRVSVYFGHYLTTTKTGSLTSDSSKLVRVKLFEEKGSDVNLATQMLIDGYERDFERAVVISNDSDLEAPVRAVRQRLGIDVHVLNPHSNTSTVLKRAATSYHEIPRHLLSVSQFPENLTDKNGTFHKPGRWQHP